MLINILFEYLDKKFRADYPELLFKNAEGDDWVAIYHDCFALSGNMKTNIITLHTSKISEFDIADPNLISSVESIINKRISTWKEYNSN